MDDTQPADTDRKQIIVVTNDSAFEQSMHDTFDADGAVELLVHSAGLAQIDDTIALDQASAIVIDLGAAPEQALMSLLRFMTRTDRKSSVVAVIDCYDEKIGGMLRQMGVRDTLVKPIVPDVLHRACIQAVETVEDGQSRVETKVITFVPVLGGAGVTTLALQTAMLLNRQCDSTNAPSTCLVDLDFQHGTVADYLDLDSRLNFDEIEPRPERLDRQLLEVMISRHNSGLAVISAPHRSMEMRAPSEIAVLRLLDLIVANFENVVIDMPRDWHPWTDVVLGGSDKVFIVSRMAIPSLRRAKNLLTAITERNEYEGPKPLILVNGCERRILRFGLRDSDVNKMLGDSLAGTIPAEYTLVREAIDRGVFLDDIRPNNYITLALQKLLLSDSRQVRPPGKFPSLPKNLRFPALTANRWAS